MIASGRRLDAASVDGPRQVALFGIRRLQAEAEAAGGVAVVDELLGILQREVVLDEPREA